MTLFTWTGFPGEKTIKGVALAETVEQARELIINSTGNHYPEFTAHILNTEPTIYTTPTGWLQEVGPQLV